MTDQPTTWTPERALQCLRDWASDECDWPKWRREYEDGIDHGEIAQDLLSRCGTMVADALESAAAEIAKMRNDAEVIAGFRRGEARLLDEVRKEAEQLRDWLANEKARADAAERTSSATRETLIRCAEAVGGGAGLLGDIPRQVAAEVERLRAELAATIRMTDESVRLAVRDERKAIEAEQAAKVEAWNTVEHGKPAEAAQQGPSDEEIFQAINRVEDLGYTSTANALWLLARRAGVKL